MGVGGWGCGWGVGGAAQVLEGFIFLSSCDISLKACQQIKVHRRHASVVDASFFLERQPRKDAVFN